MLKIKENKIHQSNLVYYGKSPNQTCTEDYFGETDCRIKERIIDHNKRDKTHTKTVPWRRSHTHIWDKDFKVLANNYRSAFKRKSSEALFIKELGPSLNVKEQPLWLHLYNWLFMTQHIWDFKF